MVHLTGGARVPACVYDIYNVNLQCVTMTFVEKSITFKAHQIELGVLSTQHGKKSHRSPRSEVKSVNDRSDI